jgi:hypothetical protein
VWGGDVQDIHLVFSCRKLIRFDFELFSPALDGDDKPPTRDIPRQRTLVNSRVARIVRSFFLFSFAIDGISEARRKKNVEEGNEKSEEKEVP